MKSSEKGFSLINLVALKRQAKRLRFNKALESEYLEKYSDISIQTPVYSLLVGAGVYLSFVFLDMLVAPISMIRVILVRISVGLPLFIWALLLFLKNVRLRKSQFAFTCFSIFGGLGLIGILQLLDYREPAYILYPEGLLLVIIFACSGIGLRFWYALLVAAVIILAFGVVMWISGKANDATYKWVFIIHTFNIVGGSILSLFACYFLEVHTRTNFLYQKALHAEQLKSIENEIRVEIQEQAIQSISLEIHDNIAQLLGLAKMTLSGVPINSLQEHGIKVFEAKGIISKSIDELRSLAKTLTADTIFQQGLVAGIESQLNHVMISRSIRIDFVKNVDTVTMDLQHQLILYRIFQEALNNCIRHAQASKIEVSLFQEESLVLCIKDNGKGFSDNKEKGIGIANMERRAKMINATFSISGGANQGTEVRITASLL